MASPSFQIRRLRFSFFLLLLCLSGSSVYAQPCASLSIDANIRSGCLPALVRLTAKGIPNGSQIFYWNFGGGNVTGGDTIFQEFTKPGKYSVSFTAKLPNGNICQVKIDTFLNFVSAPEPAIEIEVEQGCNFPKNVTFRDVSIGNIIKREWIRDGVLLPQNLAAFTIPDSVLGTHYVTLKIYDAGGCSRIIQSTYSIVQFPALKTLFTSTMVENDTRDSLTLFANPLIQFLGKPDSVTGYQWLFPGGNPSSFAGLNPPPVKYKLDSFNANDVTFRVFTQQGCVYFLNKPNLVRKYYTVVDSTVCQRQGMKFHLNLQGNAPGTTPVFVTSTLVSSGFIYSNDTLTVQTILDGQQGDVSITFASDADSSATDTLIIPKIVNVLPPLSDFVLDGFQHCSIPDTVKIKASFHNVTQGFNVYYYKLLDSVGIEIPGQVIGPIIAQDTSFIFNEEGVFGLRQIVINSLGCIDSSSQIASIFIGTPKPRIDILQDTLCKEEESFYYKDNTLPTTAPAPYAYNWEFQHKDSLNRNLKFTTRDPNVIFDIPGRYDIKFTIANDPFNIRCKDSIEIKDSLVVNGILAEFKADNLEGCLPFATTLRANILAKMPPFPTDTIRYFWQVLDTMAQYATIDDPTNPVSGITFHRNGPYSIRLIVSSEKACSTTVEMYDYIKVGTVARFVAPVRVCRDVPVLLTNNELLDPDFRNWSITPSVGATIFTDGSSASPTFVAHKAGTYTVRFITGKLGKPACSDTTSLNIRLDSLSAIAYTNDSIVRCAPVSARFYNKSVGASQYLWDFGDGNFFFSYPQDTIIDYTYPTNNPLGYTVRLSSYDSGADGTSCVDTVTVIQSLKVIGPVPSLFLDQKVGCQSLKVTFDNRSAFLSKFYMIYGDNSPIDSVSIDPHEYYYRDFSLDSNVYVPTLITIDDSNCVATYRDTVVLHRPPLISFGFDNTKTCVNEPLIIRDSSLFTTQWLWDFGDSTTYFGKVPPPHFYKASGNYTITLVATNARGCTVTKGLSEAITVYPQSQFKVSAEDSTLCFGDSTTFNLQVLSGLPAVSATWIIADGTFIDTLTGFNPSYTYKTAGSKTITLITVNVNGCKDTSIISDFINVSDSVAFYGSEIEYVSHVYPNNRMEIVFKPAPTSANFGGYVIFREVPAPLQRVGVNTQYLDTSVNIGAPTAPVQPRFYLRTLNTCLENSIPSLTHAPPFVRVGRAPFKNALAISWKPYIGWPSIDSYILMRARDTAEFFDTLAYISGSDTSFIDTGLCNTKYFYYVLAQHPNGKYQSASNYDSASPDYLFQLPPLRLKYTRVVDNKSLLLAWERSVQPNAQTYQLERNIPNVGWRTRFGSSANLSYVDEEIDVLRNVYDYRIRVLDACGNVSIPGEVANNILLQTSIQDRQPLLQWNAYLGWPEGMFKYIVQVRGNSGIFTDVADVDPFTTQFVDTSQFQGYVQAPCYRILALSQPTFGRLYSDTSISNVACPEVPSYVYIPNSFSPNDDDLNEIWRPSLNGIYNRTNDEQLGYKLVVFNRWGEIVFETNDISQGWNGKLKSGANAPSEVYHYSVKAHGFDKKKYFLSGNLYLMR